MPAQLDQPAGEELRRQVTALGIQVLTASMTRRIEGRSRRRTLHFAAGGSLTVDMVVVAAGIRPRSQLAAACGLATSPDGGIVVDDGLRTSDPRISAIGECVSHRSKLYGFVAPGYAMADVLARRLTGQSGQFEGCAPTARLKLLQTDVCSAGEPLDRGVALTFRSTGVYRRLRLERSRLVGALGVGGWPEFTRIQDATSRRAFIWPWQAARFERTGTVWRPRAPRAFGEWPADAIVCNCLSVTCGQIRAACTSGAATVETLIECTGASTLCGSCRPLLTEALGSVGQVQFRVTWGLLGVSIAAMAIAVVVALSAPIPYATSVQGWLHPDVLWRHGGYRQATGFVLVGLSVAASLLSLRKRWPRVSAGRFPTWRIVHAVVGLCGLAALVAHTGMRAGDNLNLALMTSFIALNVLGAASGGLTAIERSRVGVGPHARAAIVTAHVLAAWPLPLLVAFHVVSAYYF
jgi:nitrite reductase (NADH) large subunit